MAGILFDASVLGGVGIVEKRVDVVVGGGEVELRFGEAAAVQVPGGFEDAFEDGFLQGTSWDEASAELVFEIGEGGFLAGEDDESAGCEAVAEGVLGGCGFSCFGEGAG